MGVEPDSRLVRFAAPRAGSGQASLSHTIESLAVSPTGAVLIAGWMNDSTSPLDHIQVTGSDWSLTFDASTLARIRRPDVEKALELLVTHNLGYLGFMFVDEPLDASGDFTVEIRLKDGGLATVQVECKPVEETELRDAVLTYLASAQHFGNPQVSGMACIDGGLGSELVAYNRNITDRLVSSHYVERFGPRRHKPLGSIVVCLYGKSEYLFLQNALFSRRPGIADYEFIYICNSPELAETLLQQARIGSRVYDIDQTVVILPGNAGFGGANNAAVRFAASDRILVMNPDVFPYDLDWAAKHTDLVASLPREQTRLFGAPLYYDNGSLMHGGMYFEVDKGPSHENGRTVEWQLVRVEHFGKGAPPGTTKFLASRPVPAVTGAFMSFDRPWFEKLGGFTEDYVFGHYEDADLCLKSIQAGVAPWLHDVKLWHLEGKGSTRLPPHEGGSLVNRWLFSAIWGATIADNLVGQMPAHSLFAQTATEAPTLPAAFVRADTPPPAAKPAKAAAKRA